MTAQAQECVFEGLLLSSPEGPQDCLAQLRLAQEAAQVRTASPCPTGGLAKPWGLDEQEGLDRGSVQGRVRCHAVSPAGSQSRLLGPEGPESLSLGQHPSEQQLGPRLLSWARLGHGAGPGVGAGGGLAPGWGGAGRRLLGDPSLPLRAPQVAAEYRQVHQTMAQPPVRDYVPFPWTTLAHVKEEYFRALAHYHAAMALCDSPRECPARPSLPLQGPSWRGSRPALAPAAAEVDFPMRQQALRGHPAASEPEPWGTGLPQKPEERRKLGEAALGGGARRGARVPHPS